MTTMENTHLSVCRQNQFRGGGSHQLLGGDHGHRGGIGVMVDLPLRGHPANADAITIIPDVVVPVDE